MAPSALDKRSHDYKSPPGGQRWAELSFRRLGGPHTMGSAPITARSAPSLLGSGPLRAGSLPSSCSSLYGFQTLKDWRLTDAQGAGAGIKRQLAHCSGPQALPVLLNGARPVTFP